MFLCSTILISLFFLGGQSPQDSIRAHYERAEVARNKGDLLAAETEYKVILGEGYQRLGEIYLALQDNQRAINAFEAANTYRENSPAILVDLAIAYYDAEQYASAVAPASKVLTLEPDNAGAHQMLGKTWFMIGDLNKSISELEVAARLSPDNIDVIYTLGIAYLRNRQPDRARQLYQSMVKTFGDRPQVRIVVGRAYRQSGLLTEAAAEFKKAIELDPHFPRAHYYLGMTYLLDGGQNRMDEALAEFKIEVAANPEEFFSNYYLGVVYIYQRKWELAVPFLQKASSIQPKNPDPYFHLGQAYQELNRQGEAIDVLKKSIEFNPNLAHNKGQVTTAHHRLAQSLLKIGQTEAGQRELQLASDLKAEAFKLEQQANTGPLDMSRTSLANQDESSKASLSATNELDERASQQVR